MKHGDIFMASRRNIILDVDRYRKHLMSIWNKRSTFLSSAEEKAKQKLDLLNQFYQSALSANVTAQFWLESLNQPASPIEPNYLRSQLIADRRSTTFTLLWKSILIIISFPLSLPILIINSLITSGTWKFWKTEGAIFIEKLQQAASNEENFEERPLSSNNHILKSLVNDSQPTNQVEGKAAEELAPSEVMPPSIPIFDIDDLAFYRTLGLGLRHVGLKQGLKECKEGSNRGDAVSLANFGLREEIRYEDELEFSRALCDQFQRKVEKFIDSSFERFHQSSQHYQDAAFMVMQRENDARTPYDFQSYPLGKCGTRAFSTQNILLAFFTDKYNNEDRLHATTNTMMDLKTHLRNFKIAKTNELINFTAHQSKLSEGQRSNLKAPLLQLLEHYQKNTFIEKNIFSSIHDLAIETNISDEFFHFNLEKIKNMLGEINPDLFKGENTLEIIYKTVDLDKLKEHKILDHLHKSINDQNLKNVQNCLKYLPSDIFSRSGYYALLNSAFYPDVAISKALYAHEPEHFNTLLTDPTEPSPLAQAAKGCHRAQVEYFLTIQPIHEKSLILIEGGDACASLAFLSTREARELMELLNQREATLSSSRKGIFDNTLARAAASLGEQRNEILSFLLPLVDSYSKYMGLISTTEELYFCYKNKGDNSLADKASRALRIEQYREARLKIIHSLTFEECQEIEKLHPRDPNNFKNHGQQLLAKDLAQNELKIAKQKTNTVLVKKLQLCLGMRDQDEEANLGYSSLWQGKPAEEKMQDSVPTLSFHRN